MPQWMVLLTLRQKKEMLRYLHLGIWNSSAFLYKDPVSRIKWLHINVLVLSKIFLRLNYYKDINSGAKCSLKNRREFFFFQRILSEYVGLSGTLKTQGCLRLLREDDTKYLACLAFPWLFSAGTPVLTHFALCILWLRVTLLRKS